MFYTYNISHKIGAGKTTLLNVLTGRAVTGYRSGVVRVNNNKAYRSVADVKLKNSSTPVFAYVMQDDIHNPMLTVKETIEFAAMLRKRCWSKTLVAQDVMHTINMLGLKEVEDHVINTPDKKTLSNGQIRRLTIACEVVIAQPIVFLDEPTSGLDSYLACTVVETLRTLADAGHTLLCTIHQPSKQVFEIFDKVLLLANGHMIYHGPARDCVRYLSDVSSSVYIHPNPAEYAIAVCAEFQLLSDEEISSKLHIQHNNEVIENVLDYEDISVSSTIVNAFHDNAVISFILLYRDSLSQWRRRYFWLYAWLRSLLVSYMIGVVFQIEDHKILPRLSLFLSTLMLVIGMMIEITPMIHEEKILFYREREVKAVTTFAKWTTAQIPVAALIAFTLFNQIVIFMTFLDCVVVLEVSILKPFM